MAYETLHLQLFAEGGDGGAAAGAVAGETGVIAPDAGVQKVKQQKRRENPLANVKYGKQETPSGVAPSVEQAAGDQSGEVSARKSFDELIAGEYKDDFGKKVQGIIQQRLKGSADNEAKLSKMAPIMELLGQKYNLDPTDIDGIAKIIGDDDSLYEDEAISRGMSIESLKAVKAMERENAQLKQREQQSLEEQQFHAHFDRLAQQADKLKELYPSFDFAAEMQNPEFMRLTAPGVGVDVRTAYEVVHRDELRGAEMQYAAQRSAERMANAVRSGSIRPNENGLNSAQAPSIVKTDPRTFTRDDREEIKRRVYQGEKIVL